MQQSCWQIILSSIKFYYHAIMIKKEYKYMLNIFNTINFREKVNIDINEKGKRLILEEW